MSSIVNRTSIRGRELDLGIDDGPREVALEMRLNVGKPERKTEFGFRLDVIHDEIGKADVLPAALEIAGAVPVQEVTVERGAVTQLPPNTDIFENHFEKGRVCDSRAEWIGRVLHTGRAGPCECEEEQRAER